jgi:hypothetical protein
MHMIAGIQSAMSQIQALLCCKTCIEQIEQIEQTGQEYCIYHSHGMQEGKE